MAERVAVVGSGVMGRGIAACYALAGHPVALCDVSAALLDAARRAIEQDLALLAEEGLATSAAAEAAAARLTLEPRLEAAVAGAALVTEAVPELLELKLELFDRMERVVGDDAILASNTSTLPLSRLAQRARRPERLVVTHFFNPAHLVPLVEVVARPGADRVAERTVALLRGAGKVPVRLRREVPGFVVNRLQAALVREACHLLELGVVDAAELDAVITEGPGVRWPFIGPLETMDHGGLDTWQRVLDNLLPELSRATSAPVLVAERVARGELGSKAGRGLVRYSQGTAAERLRWRDRQLARLLRLRAGAP